MRDEGVPEYVNKFMIRDFQKKKRQCNEVKEAANILLKLDKGGQADDVL